MDITVNLFIDKAQLKSTRQQQFATTTTICQRVHLINFCCNSHTCPLTCIFQPHCSFACEGSLVTLCQLFSFCVKYSLFYLSFFYRSVLDLSMRDAGMCDTRIEGWKALMSHTRREKTECILSVSLQSHSQPERHMVKCSLCD